MNTKTITNEEVKELILKHGLTIQQVIDVVIDLNKFVGVGLITLADQLTKHIHSKI